MRRSPPEGRELASLRQGPNVTQADRLGVANFDVDWTAPEDLALTANVEGRYQLVRIPSSADLVNGLWQTSQGRVVERARRPLQEAPPSMEIDSGAQAS